MSWAARECALEHFVLYLYGATVHIISCDGRTIHIYMYIYCGSAVLFTWGLLRLAPITSTVEYVI